MSKASNTTFIRPPKLTQLSQHQSQVSTDSCNVSLLSNLSVCGTTDRSLRSSTPCLPNVSSDLIKSSRSASLVSVKDANSSTASYGTFLQNAGASKLCDKPTSNACLSYNKSCNSKRDDSNPSCSRSDMPVPPECIIPYKISSSRSSSLKKRRKHPESSEAASPGCVSAADIGRYASNASSLSSIVQTSLAQSLANSDQFNSRSLETFELKDIQARKLQCVVNVEDNLPNSIFASSAISTRTVTQTVNGEESKYNKEGGPCGRLSRSSEQRL